MRCKHLWFACSIVSSLFVLVSSAPSENRGESSKKSKSSEGKLKQFVQAEPINFETNNAIDGTEWYPTVDLSDDISDSDYPSELAAEKQAKSKTTTQPPVEKTKPKSDFKTFCEDGANNTNCSSSKSKSKNVKTSVTIEEKIEEKSLTELIAFMKSMVEKQESLGSKETKRLRELLASTAEQVEELQRNSKKGCEGEAQSGSQRAKKTSSRVKQITGNVKKAMSKNGKPHGPIAEIEEKHITETKIVKAKDHQETQNVESDVESIVEKDEVKATRPPIRTTVRTVVETTSFNPPPRPTTPAVVMSPKPEVQSTENYLLGPAEVNFNSGINRHMDDLKQRYPPGHMPDDPGFEPDALHEVEEDEEEYYDEVGENEEDGKNEAKDDKNKMKDEGNEDDISVMDLNVKVGIENEASKEK